MPDNPIGPLILLVDDHEEILEFLHDDLCGKYTVITATDGLKALEILREEPVQLVVSDVMMAGMDGFALCRYIKTEIALSHVPVILLTAKNTLQSKIEGLELGADAYIEKPFSPEYLQVQIANLLSNREKIKTYFAKIPPVHIGSMAHSKADKAFLDRLNEVIVENLTNPDFDVENLATRLFLSRPTLYRKIKLLCNLTPYELINISRLKKAAELLVDHEYPLYEIAERVGFGSQNQLGRNFLKQFGMTPSAYKTGNRKDKKRRE